MSKGAYIKGLLYGTFASAQMLEAALIYWHSDIPFEDAKMYFKNLEAKLNGTRNRLPVH
jgi:hypothetical protein